MRITTLRYDENGNLVEVETEGYAFKRDSEIPEPDDYDPTIPVTNLDGFAITGPATEMEAISLE